MQTIEKEIEVEEFLKELWPECDPPELDDILSVHMTCAKIKYRAFCKIGLDPIVKRRKSNCLQCLSINRNLRLMWVLEIENGVCVSFDSGTTWALRDNDSKAAFIQSADNEFFDACNQLPSQGAK